MIDFNSFITKTQQDMSKDFHASLDVKLPDNSIAELTASKTYFSWKGLVIQSQHVLIARIDNAKVADMKKLFENGFKFGKKINRVPLLRGMQFGYMIIPVIATTNPSKELIEYVESQPQKHWALFEFPVVLDIGSGHAHYFRKTILWGAAFFSDMRQLVSKYIEISE